MSDKSSALEEHSSWYPSGNLYSHFYLNGKIEGKRKFWYENGQLWAQSFYRNGIREGERKTWYKNREPRSQEFYRDGIREGECKNWYNSDNSGEREYCIDGVIVDPKFTMEKKLGFLHLKRQLYSMARLDPFLISDLRSILR